MLVQENRIGTFKNLALSSCSTSLGTKNKGNKAGSSGFCVETGSILIVSSAKYS